MITGSVASVIGVTLAGAAVEMCFGLDVDPATPCAGPHLIVAIITLLSTIFFSFFLRKAGFFGLIQILLGAIVGYLVSIPFGLIDLTPLREASWIQVPQFTFPAFGHEQALGAVVAIGIIAIATIPESAAHLYQISLHVDRLADDMDRKRYQLDQLIGLNLVFLIFSRGEAE